MKKFVVGLLICGSILLSGCSKDDLDGSYQIDNGYATAEVEIDGDDALMSMGGQAMNGTVDRSDETITFKDGKETEKFEYKLVGDKLSLTNDGDTLAFEKVSDDKKAKKSSAKSKESSKQSEADQKSSSIDSSSDNAEYSYEDYFSLSNGEYEVGTDIKPGSYDVDFSFFDFSDEGKEDGSGYIEVTRDGNTKKYDFANDGAEQRIIFKDRDMVNSVPENSDSEFNFSVD